MQSRLPHIPGIDRADESDLQYGRVNVKPQYEHQPKPPSNRGGDANISPKRERIVQKKSEYGADSSYNSHNSSPPERGYNGIPHHIGGGGNGRNLDDDIPSNFGTGPRTKKGAGLNGLYPPGGNLRNRGPGFSNRTPAKDKTSEVEDFQQINFWKYPEKL